MMRQLGAFSGLAMVLIVLNHAIHIGIESTALYGAEPVTGWGRYLLTGLQALGVFAVPVFLFVSGSFAAYAARARRTAGISYHFVWAALRHILIPYLIWSLIFYAAVYFLRGEQHTPLQYVKNLLVGYPYHFIPLLTFFYLLAPILLWLNQRVSWLSVLLVGVYQLFLLNVREPGLLGFAFPEAAGLLTPPILFNTMADWGVYFPLGVLLGQKLSEIRPYLAKIKWVTAVATLLLFIIALLDGVGIVNLRITRYLSPLAFMLALPVIERNAIPLARHLERVGKSAYGIYLTHLLLLEIVAYLLGTIWPPFFNYALILYPLLFAAGLGLPLLLMDGVGRSPARQVYRYIFG